MLAKTLDVCLALNTRRFLYMHEHSIFQDSKYDKVLNMPTFVGVTITKQFYWFVFCVVTVNDERMKARFKRKPRGFNLKIPYAPNCVRSSGLKATDIFVILLSQDDFKSNYSEQSSKQSLSKVSFKT